MLFLNSHQSINHYAFIYKTIQRYLCIITTPLSYYNCLSSYQAIVWHPVGLWSHSLGKYNQQSVLILAGFGQSFCEHSVQQQ